MDALLLLGFPQNWPDSPVFYVLSRLQLSAQEVSRAACVLFQQPVRYTAGKFYLGKARLSM
jgi:hypothetical protein